MDWDLCVSLVITMQTLKVEKEKGALSNHTIRDKRWTDRRERKACERKEGEGKWERGQIYQTISRSHIKEKAHLKQQALWGIRHSSASLSHQAQSEHENLQNTQTKYHTPATVRWEKGAPLSSSSANPSSTSKKESENKQNQSSSEKKSSNQW